jgi:hypothetical protein
MSKIQPGTGYGFTSGGYGFTINTTSPFPSESEVSTRHPFKVIPIGPSGSNFRYQVVSGTLNNIVPEIDDVITSTEALLDRVTSGVPDPPTGQLSISTSTLESFIYLRAGVAAASPKAFPDPNRANTPYPKIISSNVALTDTDTYGYVLLAKFEMDSSSAPTTGALYQYVSSSLWGDRIKLGTTTAQYYYARI